MIVRPLALLIVLALGVSACGGDDQATPAAQSPAVTASPIPETKSTDPATAEGNPADRAFIADMIPHHEGAIEMAAMAEDRAQSDFVRDLAAEIGAAQGPEIEQMRRIDEALAETVEIGELGVPDDAKGMHHDLDMLADAPSFDRAFLEMMIPHHEGAVVMSEALLDKGRNPELRDLAERIIEVQEREIAEMRKRLESLGDGSKGTGGASPDENDGAGAGEHGGHAAPTDDGRNPSETPTEAE